MDTNKVIINGETVIDLTSDTVTTSSLLSGITAHAASGTQITGTLLPVLSVNTKLPDTAGNVDILMSDISDSSNYVKVASYITEAEVDQIWNSFEV